MTSIKRAIQCEILSLGSGFFGRFFDGFLLHLHSLQERFVRFLLDDPSKRATVIADDADAFDGDIFHEPGPLFGDEGIVDRNLFVGPDDKGSDNPALCLPWSPGIMTFSFLRKSRTSLVYES